MKVETHGCASFQWHLPPIIHVALVGKNHLLNIIRRMLATVNTSQCYSENNY